MPGPQPKHQLLQLKKNDHHSIFLQTALSNLALTLYFWEAFTSGNAITESQLSSGNNYTPDGVWPAPICVEVGGRVPMIRRWLAQVSGCPPQLLVQPRKLVPQSPRSPHPSILFHPLSQKNGPMVIWSPLNLLLPSIRSCFWNRHCRHSWAKVSVLGITAVVRCPACPNPQSTPTHSFVAGPQLLQNVQRPIKTPAVQILKALHYPQPNLTRIAYKLHILLAF